MSEVELLALHTALLRDLSLENRQGQLYLTFRSAGTQDSYRICAAGDANANHALFDWFTRKQEVLHG